MAKKPRTPQAGSKGGYHHGDLRAALLDAAELELEERGIEKLSLRAIAKRAGVSHAAPAHHFKDMDALLTALAAVGFRKFLKSEIRRQKEASADALSQVAAAGLGYMDFAMGHPALFRLIFSSKRPDFEDPELSEASGAAFQHLVDNVGQVNGTDPQKDDQAMIDVMATWAIAHGLADLLNGGRLKFLLQQPDEKRDAHVADIMRRVLND